jgi:hypothetical protein
MPGSAWPPSEPFTFRAYGAYLDLALESGYRFVDFAALNIKDRAADPFLLHFDATALADDAVVVDAVEHAATKLERTFGVIVPAVSFHMPTRRPVSHLLLGGGRINTYGPRFFQELEYVSDSNQDWRGKDLGRVLTEQHPRALQVLTHPIWWRERYTPFEAVLRELAGRLGLDLERDILTTEQRVLLGRAGRAA